MAKAKPKTAMELLEPFHSWQLHRISPTTWPRDVMFSVNRTQAMTSKELNGVLQLVNSRLCFRCRIGKGRYFFGKTALDAVQLAVRNATTRDRINSKRK